MNKVINGVLAVCLSSILLGSCGSTDVGADLVEFRDVEMPAVIEKYDGMVAEVAMWDGFTEPDQLMDSINLVILPELAEALRLMEKIEVETDEVSELKALFTSGIQQYKRGYAGLLAAFDAIDEAAVEEAYALLEEGKATVELFYTKLDELSEKYELDTEKGETK